MHAYIAYVHTHIHGKKSLSGLGGRVIETVLDFKI